MREPCKTLLLVEDEAIIAMTESEMLKKEGYAVVQAFNGLQAVEKARGADRPIDLILMDIDLGNGMDGTQAAREILKERDIPVVFLSSHTEREIVEKTESITSYGYVVKNSGNIVLSASIKMAFKLHEAHRNNERQKMEIEAANEELNATVEELQATNEEFEAANEDLVDSHRTIMESEFRFHELFNKIAVGVAVYEARDAGMTFVFKDLNPAGERFSHVKQEEIIGRSVAEVFPGVVEIGLLDMFKRVWKTGIPEELPVTRYQDKRMVEWVRNEVYKLPSGEIVAVYEDVSARMEAELGLQESEERYRRITNSVTDYIYTVTLEHGRAVETVHGDACVAVTGYTPAEYDRDPYLWYRMVHEDDREAVEMLFGKIIAGGPAETLEHRVLHKNGSVRWVSNTPVPHRDGAGRLVSYDGLVRDITERKETEEALRVSEEKFRLLHENAGIGIGYYEIDGTVLSYNRLAASHMNGLPEDFIGKSIYEIFPGREAEFYHNRIRNAALSDGPVVYEDSVPLPSETKCFISTFTKITGSNKTISGIQIISQDITGLKRAEDALRQSEERYALTFQAVDDGIWDWHVPTGGAFFSVRYYAMLGYEDGEFPASYDSWRLLVHPEDIDRVERELRESVKTGESFTIEFRMQRKSGEWRWAQTRGRAVELDAEGMALRMVGTLSDITERRKVEDTNQFLARHGWLESGEDFFRALARHLAEIMGMDYVCIDRLQEANLAARTVAVYFDGAFGDNVEYTLKDTPCGDVVGKQVCIFQEGVRHRFPGDIVLQEMKAESYVGITLWDSNGNPIGLIAVIGRKPLPDTRLAESLLARVSARAAGELERRRTEDALRESEEKYRAIVNHSTDYIMRYDRKGRHLYGNPAALAATGVTLEEYVGKTHRDFGFPGHLCSLWESNIDRVFQTGEVRTVEFDVELAAGKMDLQLRLCPEFSPDGGVNSVIGVSRDITALKNAEESLHQLVRQKEILMKELQHRVKNNLNIVSSLLGIELEKIKDEESRSAFESAKSRIHSISAIYENLNLSSDVGGVDMSVYLADLVRSLFAAYTTEGAGIDCTNTLANIQLDNNHAVALGLIVNELLTNCIKYAFPSGERGEVRVALEKSNGHVVLSVSDNGVGIPPGFDLKKAESMGLRLVGMLSEQIGGELSIEHGIGTTVTVRFPS